jgi:predicted nucleotidyltransferase
MDKITRLRKAAKEFAQQAEFIQSVQEVALFGSLAKGDPYPKDIDLAVIVSSLDHIPVLARAARKMGSLFHNWDVFVFNSRLNYVGRLCHRKECPCGAVECIGCGDIPFIKHIREFKFTPEDFYTSHFEILFNHQLKSRFISQREQYGIEEIRGFEKFEDVMLECWECGDSFILTGGKQKYYKQHRFQLPKRCESCRIKQQMLESGLYDYDEIARFEIL